MAQMSKHHTTLTDGVGKCSVPMWSGGLPAGFCDNPAYGKPVLCAEYWVYHGDTRERCRADGRYAGYVPGLACPAHAGPTLKDVLVGKTIIRFDGPPGPEAGRFVEVERDGASVSIGTWMQDGDDWLLVLDAKEELNRELAQVRQDYERKEALLKKLDVALGCTRGDLLHQARSRAAEHYRLAWDRQQVRIDEGAATLQRVDDLEVENAELEAQHATLCRAIQIMLPHLDVQHMTVAHGQVWNEAIAIAEEEKPHATYQMPYLQATDRAHGERDDGEA